MVFSPDHCRACGLHLELFAGPWQPFGQTVLAAGRSGAAYSVASLLYPERLEALLKVLYGMPLLQAHRPVLVSQWAKYYFMQVLAPVTVAALVHAWHWPLRLDQVALALDERGIPQGIGFLEAGAVVPGLAMNPKCFARLLDDNLQPFVEALSAYGGLPRAVLWSSAGEALETCLVRMSRINARLAQPGWTLLNDRWRPDGRRNPLWQAVRYVAQAPGEVLQRQRRACCLSHRVAWVGRCEHCPLPG